MGREHNIYYFDATGELAHTKPADLAVTVDSVEHDTYGGPTYTVKVHDLSGARAAADKLRGHRWLSGIRPELMSVIRRIERGVG